MSADDIAQSPLDVDDSHRVEDLIAEYVALSLTVQVEGSCPVCGSLLKDCLSDTGEGEHYTKARIFCEKCGVEQRLTVHEVKTVK